MYVSYFGAASFVAGASVLSSFDTGRKSQAPSLVKRWVCRVNGTRWSAGASASAVSRARLFMSSDAARAANIAPTKIMSHQSIITVRHQKKPRTGFEPAISTLEGWRVIRCANRAPLSTDGTVCYL